PPRPEAPNHPSDSVDRDGGNHQALLQLLCAVAGRDAGKERRKRAGSVGAHSLFRAHVVVPVASLAVVPKLGIEPFGSSLGPGLERSRIVTEDAGYRGEVAVRLDEERVEQDVMDDEGALVADSLR